MNHGELTAHVAQVLAAYLQPTHYDVLFDHGKTNSDRADKLGKIASWVGPSYGYEAILGQLDLAVVMPGADRVAALIEIEETTDNPKRLIGDIFATLLGEHLTFQGTRPLQVGEWTTLLVLAQGTSPSHQARLDYLQASVTLLKAHTSVSNFRIGSVLLDTFADEADLGTRLKQHVDSAIVRAVEHGGLAKP